MVASGRVSEVAMGRRRPKPLYRKIEQLAASIKQPENDLEDSINKGQKKQC